MMVPQYYANMPTRLGAVGMLAAVAKELLLRGNDALTTWTLIEGVAKEYGLDEIDIQNIRIAVTQ